MLSSQDSSTCSSCKEGYYLSNENTQCKSEYKNEYTYPICWYEDDCLEDDRCEYTDRNFCESNYEDYNSINKTEFSYYFNSLWLILESLLNIGFGDFSPNTIIGRRFNKNVIEEI